MIIIQNYPLFLIKFNKDKLSNHPIIRDIFYLFNLDEIDDILLIDLRELLNANKPI